MHGPRLLIERFVFVPKPNIQRKQRLRLKDVGHSAPAGAPAFDHTLWDELLKEHVTPGVRLPCGVITSTVNYAGIAADSRFDEYCKRLSDARFDALPPVEQLALLINAYNAFCIGLIVAHHRLSSDGGGNGTAAPLASITALKQGGVAVWDQPAGTIGRVQVTLGELEHTWLRGHWDEPAIHFAIVCASASCPDLRAEAYSAEPSRLRAQLAEQAAAFFSNDTKGMRVKGNRLSVSRLLWWYAADFGGAEAALRWMADALPDSMGDVAANIRRRGFFSPTPHYFDYNWSINRTP